MLSLYLFFDIEKESVFWLNILLHEPFYFVENKGYFKILFYDF